MDYDGFLEWLKTEKNMSIRSARDTVSRLKRVLRIVDENSISLRTTDKLNRTTEFVNSSIFIKSQLRRAVTLYQEFKK